MRENNLLHLTSRPRPPLLEDERFGYAFFLDLDGTLIEIAETPDAVSVDSRLPELIEHLSRACNGALALVSGRSIADIDHLLAMRNIPVAGQHGLERRDADGISVREGGHRHSLDAVRTTVSELAQRHPEVLFEDKGLSLAVHYRRLPQLASYLHRCIRKSVADYSDLAVQQGKLVVEIKPAGIDKGSAIAAFLSVQPFLGRSPVVIGDDITDESGFLVANAARGISIKIGPGPSSAQYRLPNVGALRSWLDRLVSETCP